MDAYLTSQGEFDLKDYNFWVEAQQLNKLDSIQFE